MGMMRMMTKAWDSSETMMPDRIRMGTGRHAARAGA